MKSIPLNSLVIVIDQSRYGVSTTAREHFPAYEILSIAAIQHELVGDIYHQDIGAIVTREAIHRITLKLGLGERVVVEPGCLRRDERRRLAEVGAAAGVPVFYLIVNPFDTERDILRGDGMAEVIDSRTIGFCAIEKIPSNDLTERIVTGKYSGVTVIGDVHGALQALEASILWALSRNHFIVSLGDIVDYGPNSIECVNIFHKLVMQGRAVMVIGNHERKIEKYLAQCEVPTRYPVKLSEGNRATTERIARLPATQQRHWIARFRGLMAASRHHWKARNVLFVHAAAENATFDRPESRLQGHLESLALFGEIDKAKPYRDDGLPNRIYAWVDRLDAGAVVFVGHDIRSTVAPVTVTGTRGGIVHFMDTGSSKGGQLTTADLRISDTGFHLMNFNAH